MDRTLRSVRTFAQRGNFLFLVICMLMLLTDFTGYDSNLDSIMVVHQDFDGQNP